MAYLRDRRRAPPKTTPAVINPLVMTGRTGGPSLHGKITRRVPLSVEGTPVPTP